MSSKNKFFFFGCFSAIIIYIQLAVVLSMDALAAEVKQGEVYVYDSQGKRDPFLPLVSLDGRILEPQIAKDGEGKPQLEGIIYEAGNTSYAVVNGEVVRAGDASGPYQILEIYQEKVVFVKGGERLEIELKKE